MPIDKDLAGRVLNKAKKVSDEAEVFAIRTDHFNIDVMNGRVESIDEISDAGISIRLIKGSRSGFAYTADVDEEAIDDAISAASESLALKDPDENLSFPDPVEQKVPMQLTDTPIALTPPEEKIKLALSIEKAAYAYDNRIKKTEKVSYHDTRVTTIIANSRGVNVGFSRSACGAIAEVIAEGEGQMESGIWLAFSRKLIGINDKVGTEAAKRAVDMIGAKQEKSGIAPVIFSPWAGATLISALSPALSAEYVQKGKSLFAGALEKPVASFKFSLIDSGIIEDGIGSAPYDDEGVPTKETYLIKDGFLKSFLHDQYTAKKAKTSSTANCFRQSFKSPPEIMPSNLYIKPGHKTRDELISDTPKGFLVNTIMGAHTINPISGDFSIGFSGFLIENGKLARPVRGMTLAGNILDVFNHIENVANDLSFFPHNGNIGAPTILVSRLSISGT